MSRIIPVLFFWGIFIFVVLKIPYPESLTQADFTQIGSFLIPLFLALILTFNIFLKNFYISFSIALGFVFLLILKALDSLGAVTGILVIISIGLLYSYFRKTKREFKGIRRNHV